MPRSLTDGATKEATLHAFRHSSFIDAQSFAAFLNGTADTMPQQLHLALTGDSTTMSIAWATAKPVGDSQVVYWPTGLRPVAPPSVVAAQSTYTAGITGWAGQLYSAIVTGLVPGGNYTYSVGSPSLNLWSTERTFRAATVPAPTASIKMAITADQGTIVPLGWAVADVVTKEHITSGRPFDAVLLSGDLSYATVSPPRYEIEWTWDAFLTQVEPYASTTPFMTTVGNHEATPGNITNSSGIFYDVWGGAFASRFVMPGDATGGFGNLWFSFDVGPVHFASLSSEHNYSSGSPQALWLEADLARVDRTRTPCTDQ
jgi:hypothetical protein